MKLNQREISVIGHKNPDTDSICSAIAYAWLKNEVCERESKNEVCERESKNAVCERESKNEVCERERKSTVEARAGETPLYRARRAGELNPETAYVLQTFDIEAPEYLADVRLQVRDANLRESHPIDKNLPLKNAWTILNEEHLSTLPVIDETRHLEGLITLGDIAKSFMGVYGSTILSEAGTPYKNILETLEAKLVVGDPDCVVTEGKVLIAAANPDLMEDYIEEKDIVILGDRYESQLCAIEMRAACLIICMDAQISPTILKLAEENGCAIMQTGYDTFLTARLVNQSIPVSHFMVRSGLRTFYMDDYIENVTPVMSKERHRDFPVLDHENHYIGMLSRTSLIDMQKKQLILVDHNERSQAVDGIADANILEIIDHHKLGHIETLSPVTFRNQPVGCTGTIIYLLYQEEGVDIPPAMAGMMCSAIISDTLLFRSPTCTPVDERICRKLAQIAGIDLESYASAMFDAGSDLRGKTGEEIFYQDFKRFSAGSITFGVGQITAMSMGSLREAQTRIRQYLDESAKGREEDMVFFMLTHILTESTVLLYDGVHAQEVVRTAFADILEEEEMPEKAAGGQEMDPTGGFVNLPGVVSRKKQLIPRLLETLVQM